MNQATNDLNRTIKQINDLCGACDTPFRINLTEFASAARLSNTPRRKVFDLISDAMTCNELIAKIGMWCIAEVEGADVQFNRVVEQRRSVLEVMEESQSDIQLTTLAAIQAHKFTGYQAADAVAIAQVDKYIADCRAMGDVASAEKAADVRAQAVSSYW